MRDPTTDHIASLPGVAAQTEFSRQIGREEPGEPQYVKETPVEIISAVSLTARQRQTMEVRLIRMLKKRINLKFTVDPDLLGGVRIVAENIVIDDSIKRKLHDMKTHITKGVFQTE